VASLRSGWVDGVLAGAARAGPGWHRELGTVKYVGGRGREPAPTGAGDRVPDIWRSGSDKRHPARDLGSIRATGWD
jgi:hypothetical protein